MITPSQSRGSPGPAEPVGGEPREPEAKGEDFIEEGGDGIDAGIIVVPEFLGVGEVISSVPSPLPRGGSGGGVGDQDGGRVSNGKGGRGYGAGGGNVEPEGRIELKRGKV